MNNPVHIKAFIRILESYNAEKEPLSTELREYLSEVIQERSYPRKHLLLHENQVPYYVWYIIEGAARLYRYDEYLNREITSWFWYSGDMMIVPNSFYRQLKTGENIELLSDSLLLQMTFENVETLNFHYPEYRKIEQAMTEDYHSRFISHYRSILNHGNRHRYLKLKETHHEVFNLANIKDIASFLNMHPKSLGSLRLQGKVQTG